MNKVSVWKRFGGWLRRSNSATGGVDVVSVDAERIGVGPGETVIEDEANSLATRDSVAEQKLAAIEDGFNRLVDVMGQVNETITKQQGQNEQLQKNLEPMGELMRQFPTVVQNQGELVDRLAEQMAEQVQQHEELAEAMKALPEQNQVQVEQLGDITRQMESSVQTEGQMLENMKAQSTSLANMGQLLEKNEQRLTSSMEQQRRQLSRLFWVAIGLSVIAIAAVGVAIWLAMK